MRSIVFLIGLLFSFPALAGVFNPQTFTLANGMQVVLVTNTRVPVVNHMVWYKVGAADEPIGKSGIAHFFEHLMFKGTEKIKPGEFSKIVAINGGRDNAFTSYDYTAYFQTVAKDRLPLMMELEADRMKNLTLTKEIIEPERLVILEERRQRTDNNPSAQLREQINTVQYQNHPYRIPVIGWAHEVEALSLDDLTTFYKKWYAPQNAVLIVEGDMTIEELKPLAEKYYGAIKGGDVIVRNRPKEPPSQADRRVILKNERVTQPSISRVYIAPSYHDNHGQARMPYALQVLENILSGSSTSRLYQSLVVNQSLAVSTGMEYSPSALDISEITFWIAPREGISIDEAEQALINEINLLVEKGVSQDEVERAKKSLSEQAIFARDQLGTASQVIGTSLSVGLTLDDVEQWPDMISSVTVSDVNQAIQSVFKNKHTVTGILLTEDNPS